MASSRPNAEELQAVSITGLATARMVGGEPREGERKRDPKRRQP